MSQEADFNDVLDDIVRGEERQQQDNYEEGLKAGRQEGNPEGYHLGYHRGAELGSELGYYLGVVTRHLCLHNKSSTPLYADKVLAQLKKVEKSIVEFPRTNSDQHDLLATAETIRAQYRKACALLKIDSRYPYSTEEMDSRLVALHRHADRAASYLTPLLPLANCHTVELLTGGLWRRHVPEGVRREVEALALDDAVERFWRAAEGDGRCDSADSELVRFVRTARRHHLSVDGVVCLSSEQMKRRVEDWGGRVDEDLMLDQFVSPKKGHEVREMMWLAGSLGGSHYVELGGGKGYLGEAVARCRGAPALTVDCDGDALAGGERRTNNMQRVMPKKTARGATGRHRYAKLFVDEATKLADVVKRAFPEDFTGVEDDARLVITGLHTCGDLGPSSLRIFVREPSAAALCNVPCCYHLLSETVEPEPLCPDVESGSGGTAGFPMSQYLRGYQLGRNARMLASQSIERAVASRALPHVGLHYRAILQVLLRENFPKQNIPEGRLKGVAAKCKNFEQYFKMAVAKLNLGTGIQLPGELTDVEEEYKCHWKSFVMFYLLRLCLAQVVENLILLDRLLYLIENGFDKVCVVKLFDASKSPRCHAIVALR